MSRWVGKLSDRYGPGPLIAAGSAIVAVAFALMALTVPLRAFWSVTLPLCALMGFGMAFVVSPLSTAVMGSVPSDQTGTASGVNNAVSRMAGLVAVAAMGSLAAITYAQSGGSSSFGEISGNDVHRAATDAGFQAVLWVTALLAFISAIIAWIGLRPDATGPGDKDAKSRGPEPEAQ